MVASPPVMVSARAALPPETEKPSAAAERESPLYVFPDSAEAMYEFSIVFPCQVPAVTVPRVFMEVCPA